MLSLFICLNSHFVEVWLGWLFMGKINVSLMRMLQTFRKFRPEYYEYSAGFGHPKLGSLSAATGLEGWPSKIYEFLSKKGYFSLKSGVAVL